MSGPELTQRERELLAAVRELLDIPDPASDQGYGRHQDEVAQRAAWLCGYLRDKPGHGLDHSRADVMIATIRRHSAHPLPYVPET